MTTPKYRRPFFVAALAILAPAWAALAGVTFTIRIEPGLVKEAVSGRVVVSLIPSGAKLPPGSKPMDAPFWDAQVPMFAMDVKDVAPDGTITLDDSADGATGKLSALRPGEYAAQARLIRNRRHSRWSAADGNLFSGTVANIEVPATGDAVIPFMLDSVTSEPKWKEIKGVELFEIKSEMLSTFHSREVKLRAAVGLPKDYDPAKKYAAVYEVPGFGGDHFVGRRHVGRVNRAGSGATAELLSSAFVIYLDPESPNGHTLFADSDNNGPCGQALIDELIPALEKKYPLIAQPEARLLRGHSSGGWSTLWLALTYPKTFGAAWPSSPDPVDFRRFQLTDIYTDENMYVAPTGDLHNKSELGPDHISYRRGGKNIMTMRQENAGERMIGANQTSGMQFASWQAVASRRDPKGHPVALYDAVTGTIDKAQLDQWKKYDIAQRIRDNPKELLPIMHERVHLVCGDKDNFFLERAVMLLKRDVDELSEKMGIKADGPGYIKLVPGADHGSIFGSAEMQGFDAEMVAHLKTHGIIKPHETGRGDAPKSPAGGK